MLFQFLKSSERCKQNNQLFSELTSQKKAEDHMANFVLKMNRIKLPC